MFCCIVYAHVPDPLKKKLKDKAEKYIFIEYSSVTKGYKLYNPITEKVIISRDVIFDKQSVWDWSQKEDKLVTLVPFNVDDSVDDQSVE